MVRAGEVVPSELGLPEGINVDLNAGAGSAFPLDSVLFLRLVSCVVGRAENWCFIWRIFLSFISHCSSWGFRTGETIRKDISYGSAYSSYLIIRILLIFLEILTNFILNCRWLVRDNFRYFSCHCYLQLLELFVQGLTQWNFGFPVCRQEGLGHTLHI